MSNLIALAFSDLHLHRFQAFGANSRLVQSLAVLRSIGEKAKELGVPVLFTGDLFHNETELENATITRTLMMYDLVFERPGVKFFAISGNHDMSERNGRDRKSISYLDAFTVFKTFRYMDVPGLDSLDKAYKFVSKSRTHIQGIPYMNNDTDTLSVVKEFRKEIKRTEGFKILLLHQDLPGATTPSGIEVGEVDGLKDTKKLFKAWDLVLCGHIHKPQRIYTNTYMLGSPIHQNAGDEGCKMGYWEVYDDAKMKFICLNEMFPTFITLKDNETPYNKKDYFIRLPKDDLADENVKSNEFHLSNSKRQLADSYITLKKIRGKTKKKALKKILTEL